MCTAFAALVLLLAASANARQLMKADTSDPTPPGGGQADAAAGDTRAVSEKPAQRFFSVTTTVNGTQQTKRVPATFSSQAPSSWRPQWVSSASSPKKLVSTAATKNRTDNARNLAILDSDDRSIYCDLSYPWGTVVKIYNSAGLQGSGVLIGPRHVLTASHVINWDDPNSQVTVEVGRCGDSVAATSTSRKIYQHTVIRYGAVPGEYGAFTETNKDEDYAVVSLNDDLGNVFGYMGIAPYNSIWDGDATWSNIAYPLDRYLTDPNQRGKFPTYQSNKWLDEDKLDLDQASAMRTDADAYPGMSGSPMFLWSEGYAVVVAVMSNEQILPTGSRNWCAGGVSMWGLVGYARSDDP